MRREWSQYYRTPELHDLEVLHARFIEHRFARHAHEYLVIGYVETGVQAYSYRGARHVTPAGHIFLVNPGETHTGEAAIPGGYLYRTVYPRTALLEQVAADTTGRATLPFFRDAVLDDRILVRLLTRFHRAVAASRSRLAIESLLTSALAHLIVRHADGQFSSRRVGTERTPVRRGREYIEAHFAADLSLAELSAVAGLSPFHFARAFAKDVGLPPHAYLEAVRIRKAREMLDRGVAIAAVALSVGYADQTHLTHRFKRVSGITPGVYVRARKIRQDAGRPLEAR